MGEIADDCYDRVLDEMEERDADPHWDGYHSPRFYPRQQTLPLAVKPQQEFAFIAIATTWPFYSRNFLVKATDLAGAVADFYLNEYHKPFRRDQDVPEMSQVQPQASGGWVVHGEDETVIIHQRQR